MTIIVAISVWHAVIKYAMFESLQGSACASRKCSLWTNRRCALSHV